MRKGPESRLEILSEPAGMPGVGRTIQHFARYWFENFKAAREGYELVLASLGCLIVVAGHLTPIFGLQLDGDVRHFFDLVGIGLAAVTALVWLPYRRYRALEVRLEPQLRITCGPSVEGSHAGPSNLPFVEAGTNRLLAVLICRWLRLRVETSTNVAVRGARGQLIRIEKDGETRWADDEAILTFAPGEQNDTTAKTIQPRIPCFLDVLFVTREGQVSPAVLGRQWRYQRLEEIFRDQGTYDLTVIISAIDVTPVEVRLNFNWTGDWNTAELVLAETPATD